MDEIEKEKVLIVEGNDDEKFIIAFLQHENIKDVQVINLGGETKIKQAFPLVFTRPSFDIIKKLAIIRDANSDSEAKFQSCKNHIENNNLVSPNSMNSFSNTDPSVGIFIITKPNSNEGMLEDLCLETVKDTEQMKCVEIFFDCIDHLSDKPRNLAKSKCQAYSATLPESYPHVGIAAEKGVFPFDHPSLNELRVFLHDFTV